MGANASFGQWLKERRKALDLTQKALAQKVDCAVVTIQKIEAEERRPSRQMAQRLAQQLGVPRAKRTAFVEFARSVVSPPLGVWATSFHPAAQNIALAPLIGRDNEIDELKARLAQEDIRLLTLAGPGGIGKTRLAIEIAQRFAFPDGVHFVPLQSLTSSNFLVSAIATGLRFQFYQSSNPRQQLLGYLREKSLLLILDNFEHLLDGAELLSEILAHAPGVRLLITSRERLNLVEEWVMEVGGLTYPSSENDSAAEPYSAVELFVQRASRVTGSHRLPNRESPAVGRICRLVGGMPLGIELAASWVRALSCEGIADEIERSLDILETSVHNVEPRHRTLRAAFTPTWEQLTDHERNVFMKLSVFSGGFTREAAESVAGTTLPTLSALVDKSLVYMDVKNRYDLHNLLRQYAEEKLTQSGQIDTTRDAHCAYYATVLAASDHVSTWGNQRFIELLKQDAQNFRSAIRRAIDTRQLAAMESLQWVLKALFYELAWYQEKVEYSQRAVERLRQGLDRQDTRQLRMLGGYLHSQSVGLRFLGQIEESRKLAQESLGVLLPLGASRELSHTYNALSAVAATSQERKELLAKALGEGRKIDYGYALAAYNANLGWVAFGEGNYDEAGRLADEALKISKERSLFHVEANTLRLLGAVALQREQYSEAKRWIERALLIDHQTGFWGGLSSEDLLGHIALMERNNQGAIQYFQSMLATAKDLGIPSGMAIALNGLGRAACRLGDRPGARARLLEAFHIAERLRNIELLLNTTVATGELLALEGSYERSFELFKFALENRQCDWQIRLLAEQVLAEMEYHFAPNLVSVIEVQVETINLDNLAKVLFAVLAEPMDAAPQSMAISIRALALNTITERELVILRLIAKGFTNQEIAEQLVVGVSTVKKHINHIYGKLDVKNRTQAVVHARELQLLTD